MLTVLINVADGKVPDPVLIGIVLPASVSSIIIDFKTHYSMLRVLHIIGATPRQVKMYVLIQSTVLPAIYGMPYITMSVFRAVLVFVLSLFSSLMIMMFILRIVKKGFSTSIVM